MCTCVVYVCVCMFVYMCVEVICVCVDVCFCLCGLCLTTERLYTMRTKELRKVGACT